MLTTVDGADRANDRDTPQPTRRAGFSFLEVLVAVGLLSVVGLVALHSRSVMIRAEHKAYRLEQARMIMRDLLAHRRTGMENEDLKDMLPAGWQWTETPVAAEISDASGELDYAPWHIWRLVHAGSDTVLEIAVNNFAADTNAQESKP